MKRLLTAVVGYSGSSRWISTGGSAGNLYSNPGGDLQARSIDLYRTLFLRSL